MNRKLINVIPYPKKNFSLSGNLSLLEGFNIATTDSSLILPGIFSLYENCSIPLFLNKNDKNLIVINISIKQDKPDSVTSITELKKEEYKLVINEKGISIEGCNTGSIFYGLVSLLQIAFDCKNRNLPLPFLEIQDSPEYLWRGFLLDTVRSFFSVDFIKKNIDLMALHKLNVFHWHLTDDQGWRFNVSEYPELIRKGTVRKAYTMPESNEGEYDGVSFEKFYYSDEEILEIIEYAKNRNIMVVPEIEFPGHASALLASYPQFGCLQGPYNVENRWGIFKDTICLGKDAVFDFYETVFKKIEKLFPSKYIHIGGDECLTERWCECPDCQKRMNQEKLTKISQLQSWGTKKISEILHRHGKTAIGWDEILNDADTFPLPEEVIVQSWQGVEGGEKASSMNHFVIMSPQSHCYLNLKNHPSPEEPGRLGCTTIEKTYEFSPITEKMNSSSKEKILGGECAFWSEEIKYSRTAEYLIFPRFCSMAECLWLTSENKNYERFSDILETHKTLLEKMNVNFCRW